MPRLARLFVKTALLYLALGLVIGVTLAAPPDVLPPWLSASRMAWVHVLVVGWLTQLIFGVAFWFFPRHSRERPYGAEGLAWAAFWLLNAGLLARVVAEPLVLTGGGAAAGVALVASAAAQALGAVLFVVYLWPRVRTK